MCVINIVAKYDICFFYFTVFIVTSYHVINYYSPFIAVCCIIAITTDTKETSDEGPLCCVVMIPWWHNSISENHTPLKIRTLFSIYQAHKFPEEICYDSRDTSICICACLWYSLKTEPKKESILIIILCHRWVIYILLIQFLFEGCEAIVVLHILRVFSKISVYQMYLFTLPFHSYMSDNDLIIYECIDMDNGKAGVNSVQTNAWVNDRTNYGPKDILHYLIPNGQIDNESALVQVMAWHHIYTTIAKLLWKKIQLLASNWGPI